MKTPKSQYLQGIRSQSSYKTYRFFGKCVGISVYIIGAFLIFDAFMTFLSSGSSNETISPMRSLFKLHIGIIVGIICIVVGKVVREALLMVADVADSMIDVNARGAQE